MVDKHLRKCVTSGGSATVGTRANNKSTSFLTLFQNLKFDLQELFTPKFGEECRNSKLLKLCQSRTRLHEGSILADSEEALESALFE